MYKVGQKVKLISLDNSIMGGAGEKGLSDKIGKIFTINFIDDDLELEGFYIDYTHELLWSVNVKDVEALPE